MSDVERIAKLEKAEEELREDISEIKKDVKGIVRTLSEMSGGKKALLGLFAIIGAVVGMIGTLFAIQHH